MDVSPIPGQWATRKLIVNSPRIASLPALIVSPSPQADPIVWLVEHRASFEAMLLQSGAVLLRGFEVGGIPQFEECVVQFRGKVIEYLDRVTKRTALSNRIYTSTDAAPLFTIAMHSESSFAASWPGYLFLYCQTPAEHGGRTQLADTRQIYANIPSGIRDKFEQHGVLYVRNFGGGPGMSWQDAFDVANRQQLEAYCADAGIEAIWMADERLQTRQRRPAVARHPITGETVWFNHATTLHVSSLDPLLAETLLRQLGEQNLPHQTYFGDGTPIDSKQIGEIRAAYVAATTHVAWERGDLLILDNMLTAHGREPYEGERRIAAALSTPLRWRQIEGGRGTVEAADSAPSQASADGKCDELASDSESADASTADMSDELQAVLLATVRELLKQQRLGPDENLLKLGCDSMIIARIINRVKQQTGVELTFRAFFETPTIAEIARRF